MTDELATRETSTLIASDKVEGTLVYGIDGEHLGVISNFMVDKVSGRVDYAVLQFGGVLGIAANHYPLPWQQLTYDENKGGYSVNLTREAIEGGPHYAEQAPAFTSDYGQSVSDYYQPPMMLI